ncbi:MAG TPA: hypothetical protein ENF16_07580 [Bacteroidetes bacterium]|nr:hypothetical protein [Bacteroidota bacterium]
MTTLEYILIIGLILLVIATLIWAYRKRNRLFFQMKFVAETTMMNYQDASKRAAMEEVAYRNEEAEEDESGEDK